MEHGNITRVGGPFHSEKKGRVAAPDSLNKAKKNPITILTR